MIIESNIEILYFYQWHSNMELKNNINHKYLTRRLTLAFRTIRDSMLRAGLALRLRLGLLFPSVISIKESHF